jgi:sporulation protein YlmC with PRC-barrel domain
MMTDDFVVTWGGKYFGWIEDNDLFTHDGRHVGRFVRTEVFGKTGAYLGEMKDHRLIANIAKKHTKKQLAFLPQRLKMVPPRVRPANEPALDLPAGFDEFPVPENL